MTGHRINVTLSTASVFPRRAHFAFELAARLGYDGVEVMVWSESVTQDPVKLLNLSQHYNVPITSIHAPSLVVSQSVWGSGPPISWKKPCTWQSRWAQGRLLFTHLRVAIEVRGYFR